jgi:hypothetical protein
MTSTLRTAVRVPAVLAVPALLAGLVTLASCSTSTPAALPPARVGSASPAAPSATGASSTMSIPAAVSAAGSGAPRSSSAAREVNPAGDIPDNQAFVPYTPSTGSFTVTVPEGWARTATATGVLFTDKYNSIRVESRTATSAPTTSSVRSSEVPALSGTAANFQLGEITTAGRKAGAAVLLTYHADTPPNPVTGKVTTAAFERYVFFRGGTEVLITVGAPVGGDNVDPWRRVTDSFSWSR